MATEKKEVSNTTPTEEVSNTTPTVELVKLVSKLDHPVTINYLGETFLLPPRGTTKRDLDRNKLGAIPKGVIILNK